MGEVPCTAFTDRTAPSLKGLHAARLQRNRVLFFLGFYREMVTLPLDIWERGTRVILSSYDAPL